MKMGKAHTIPLTESPLDVLERVRLYFAPISNLVFPGKNVKRPLSDMTLIKVLRAAELPYTILYMDFVPRFVTGLPNKPVILRRFGIACLNIGAFQELEKLAVTFRLPRPDVNKLWVLLLGQ